MSARKRTGYTTVRKLKKEKVGKGSSPATYTLPFFTFRKRDMMTAEKDITCSPKAHEIGRVHKSVK
jgi:hypothetical protein